MIKFLFYPSTMYIYQPLVSNIKHIAKPPSIGPNSGSDGQVKENKGKEPKIDVDENTKELPTDESYTPPPSDDDTLKVAFGASPDNLGR